MKFGVLALDYDGTTAEHGVLHPEVRAAVRELHRRDVFVVLVTGRILGDLVRTLEDPCLFDAIVAENGAVLTFPGSEQSIVLGQPPPPQFLHELHARGVELLAGQCVVEMGAEHAGEALAVVRELELPLALLFNRGRLMVLSQAVSKATGLREALRALRLSAHNAVAVGDAENDHEMLTLCELGVAVGWGSPALKAAADVVLEGEGPAAVARYVRELARSEALPLPARSRHRVELGTLPDGAPLALTLKDRNTLIAGDTKTGKSWITGLVCEQLVLQRYCVCVIDPEGDYGALELLPGVVVMTAAGGAPRVEDVERTLRYPDVSVDVDLSLMPAEEKRGYVRELLARLRDLRRRTGLPHRVVVDEAHYFLHDPDANELLDLELAGYTLVTYRASLLDPEVLSAIGTIVVTGVGDRGEARALRELRGPGQDGDAWEEALRDLPIDEGVLLPGAQASGERLLRFRFLRRLTPHVRHRTKYLDVPVRPSEAFAFTLAGEPTAFRARTLSELVSMLPCAPPESVAAHARNHDLSRWIDEVFADPVLAGRLRELEERAEAGEALALADALARAIEARYAEHAGVTRSIP